MAIDAINRHDLSKRKPDWLVNAAQSMARATKRDWESFQSSHWPWRARIIPMLPKFGDW
jgi:hypothetical protein